jgi:hypothetical protein
VIQSRSRPATLRACYGNFHIVGASTIGGDMWRRSGWQFGGRVVLVLLVGVFALAPVSSAPAAALRR